MTDARAPDDPFSAGCAWIEGEYVPVAEARVPILDSGFVRSDCTYDVAAVWKGRFFRLDDHLDRVFAGCDKLRLVPPVTKDEAARLMHGVVARSGLRDAYVEVVFTRGVPPPGGRDPRQWRPRVYVYAVPYVWIVRPEAQEQGIDVVVSREVRRIPTTSVDPTVKNFHWADFTRGLYEAYDRGAVLAVLPDASGDITEGPGCNVFAVIDGVLRTPAVGVLEGITRRTVLEIATELGLAARVGPVTADEIRAASEVFLTSTAGGVMPVATLDGAAVGAGRMGPLTRRIREAYWAWHSDPRWTTPVRYP